MRRPQPVKRGRGTISDHVVTGAQEAAAQAPVLAMPHRLHRRAARIAWRGASSIFSVSSEGSASRDFSDPITFDLHRNQSVGTLFGRFDKYLTSVNNLYRENSPTREFDDCQDAPHPSGDRATGDAGGCLRAQARYPRGRGGRHGRAMAGDGGNRLAALHALDVCAPPREFRGRGFAHRCANCSMRDWYRSPISQNDGRNREYRLTSTGERALADLKRSREAAIESVWMTQDASEIESFAEFARKLVRAIEDYSRRGDRQVAAIENSVGE